jgi:hypothetical protein
MQALARLEREGVPVGIDNLIGPADQMHFHARQICVRWSNAISTRVA